MFFSLLPLFPRRLKGLGPERTAETIEDTLNHVNLAYVRNNPVSSFSGGMKVLAHFSFFFFFSNIFFM